jgi:hypothetical protein
VKALRRFAARIYDGSVVIGWRLGRWPWQDKAWRSRTGRLAWVAFVCWAGWRLIERFQTLAAVAVAWFLVAAFRAAATDTPQQQPPDDAGEQLPAGDQTDHPPGDFAELLRTLITDGPGIHLAEVAQAMTGNPKDTAAVREQCTRAGIPVAAGTRSATRPGVSTGIRAADLPPPPPPTSDTPDGSPVAVVAAGHSEQHDQQQQQQQQSARIVPAGDGNPNRWHVQWDDAPGEDDNTTP